MFAYLAVILMLLPPFAAMNSILTNWLNQSMWWQPIQDYIVPWEARLVAAAIAPFGVDTRITPGALHSTFYMIKNGSLIPVYLSWNCLGWQSALLFGLSLFAGLRGKFTNLSRIECILFGLFGTLLLNIFRMGIIALGIFYVNSFAAQILHDYFAAFLTIIWLIVFWWFSYKYILQGKREEVALA